MAELIKMPRLSDTMKSGKIVKWHKKVGDKISEGDILAEIETDKAIQDFEIDINGTLLFIGVNEQETTQVDEILAIIGEDGENISELINKKSNFDYKNQIKNNVLDQKNNYQNINIDNNNIDNNQRIFVSPLAKKIAHDIGISLLNINGSGDNGRIIKRDIEEYYKSNYSNNIKKNFSLEENIININTSISKNSIPNSSMRKTIAEKLYKSKITIPNYYLSININMDQAIYYRNLINKNISDVKISFNDFIVKAVAIALRDNPQINTSWTEENIIYHSDINIGIVVSVKDGLFVPVIHKTDKKSLKEISIEIKDKANRAKKSKIEPKEIEGSTITISNLGMYGIHSFTSIINQPNSCIISVGSIIETPIVKNGKICVGNTINITLSCDHRTIDGAIGSKFLQSIKNILETPILMLC